DSMQRIAEKTQKRYDYSDVLETNKKYYWQIKTLTDYGDTIESKIFSFKTTLTPPGPFNIFPEDEKEIEGESITLKWEGLHSDKEDLTYDFYFGEKSTDLTDIGVELEEQSFTVNALEKGERYYWKVIGKYENGGIAESELWSFSVKLDPPKLENLSPQNLAVDLKTNPVLKWKINRELEGLKFDVYCSTKSAPQYLKRVKGDSQIELNDLQFGTTYYWKVTCEIDGRIIEGPVWSFKTISEENHKPSVPNNPSPNNKEEGVGLSLYLSWNSYDIDGDQLNYNVFFGDSIENLQKIKSNTPSNECYIADLDYDSVYYWQVIAFDSDSYTEGPIWHFLTESKPSIEKPQVYSPSPANNAKNIDITTTLSWHSEYSNAFDVYFGTSAHPSYYKSTNKNHIEIPLEEGKNYYWRIVAKGEGGATSSELWNFSTKYSIDQSDDAMKSVIIALGNASFCLSSSFSASTNSGSIKINPEYYSMKVYDLYSHVKELMMKDASIFFPLELRAAGPDIGTRLLLGRFGSFSEMDAALKHEDVKDLTLEELLEYVSVLKFFYTEQWYNIAIN
ncbi:MAG: hypothetical protein ACOCUH_04730, partial [Bacteriovoracia bacterium]